MAALTFLLVLFALETVRAEVYTDVWPLGESTCGYDVMAGYDAILPTLDVCCIEPGSQHPALTYKSLAFSGASYLDLTVEGDAKDQDLSFMVNFKPAELSGTIFHFFESQTAKDCLWDLRVTLGTDGKLSVYVYAEGMKNGPKTFTSPYAITLNNWNYLSVGLDHHSGFIQVVHQKYGSSKVDWTMNIGSDWHAHFKGTNRRLRVGADSTGGNAFKGDLTCVSIAKEIKDPQYDTSITYCQGTWNKRPPTAPTCNIQPLWVVPTYQTNAGYDVKQNTSRRHQNGRKDLRVNPTLTPLNYGSLLMDGSPFSTVDLNFNPSTLQGNFTLTFYVKANQSVMGTLAHARMSAATGKVLKEVVVSVNVTHALATFLSGEGSVCGGVTASRSTQSSWDVVGVGRKGDRLFLMYGSDMGNENSSCSVNPSLSGTGLLRLGGSLDEGEGFHGNLACFVLFEKYAYSAKFTIDACKGPHSIPPGTPVITGTEESYWMSLMETDFEPVATLLGGSAPKFGSEFTTRSLAECAKFCRLHHHCRSFTVSKVKDSSRERRCRLLDFLTREGLQARAGTNYYAMVRNEETP